jgi:hypothetical protein
VTVDTPAVDGVGRGRLEPVDLGWPGELTASAVDVVDGCATIRIASRTGLLARVVPSDG